MEKFQSFSYLLLLTAGQGVAFAIVFSKKSSQNSQSNNAYFLGLHNIFRSIKTKFFNSLKPPTPNTSESNTYTSEEKQTQALLEEFMQTQQPYLQHDLTLGALASMLHLKPNYLSRVINNCYQKNFFDFVNSYRVQHFIEKAPLPEQQHKTLLGIALEVGFNSKSTFNRAFKKEYGVPPTTYFKQAQVMIGC